MITGAARGIGRAIATRLAGEGAGVCLVDRSERVEETAAALACEHGRPVLARVADVTDRASIRDALAAAAAELGRVDVVFNNAGLSQAKRFVATEMWEQADEEMMALGLSERPGQAMEDFAREIVLGRVSTPADVAAVAAFLASDDSSSITGQAIVVDGGMVFA